MLSRLRLGLPLALFVCAFLLQASPYDPGIGGLPDRTSSLSLLRSIVHPDPRVTHPAGLAYSSSLGAFVIANSEGTDPLRSDGGTVLPLMTPSEDNAGALTLAGPPARPLDMTFDGRLQRLIGLEQGGRFLTETSLQAGALTGPVRRFDISRFGLQDPHGMALDPLSGTLFVLDMPSAEIVRVTPSRQRLAAGGARLQAGRVTRLPLYTTGSQDFRGIALNPSNGHLYVLSPSSERLYEVTTEGDPLAFFDVAPLALAHPGAMVFAPSADRQTNPTSMSLYVTDAGCEEEAACSGGRIVELRFSPPTEDDGPPPVRSAHLTNARGGSPNQATAGATSGPGGIQVSASSDDAEENTSGTVNLTSSDLELVHDSTDQTIGIRFRSLAIPQGARIASAYIQFQVDEAQSETTHLTFYGQAIDNAPTFTTSSKNVTSRSKTSASATWDPQAWSTIGQAGSLQKSADLSAIIQEIVGRSGWTSGNSIVILINGTGHRTAVAFDGTSGGAPTLFVQVQATTVNLAPVVSAGSDQTITLPATANLNGTVTDDGLPTTPGTVTTLWTKFSGPGTVTFGNASAVDTTASFSEAGTYFLELAADDGDKSNSNQVRIIVNDAGGSSASTSVRIAVGSDDAEESSSGSMSLTSSDLELVHDSTDQVVGLRFKGVGVGRGATITRAYVQFQADETQSETTSLTIFGQDADNPTTFTTSSKNVSGRARLGSSVTWNPSAWNTVGEAGTTQQTSDLSPIIQSLVNRSGWSFGNSIVLIITGTGHRTAVATDGDPAAGPLLVVEFVGGDATPGNQQPTVSAGSDKSISLTQTASLSGSATDDGLPNPPGQLTLSWSKVSGPGTVTFASPSSASTTASFSVVGTYVARLTADDGDLTASDDVTVVVGSTTPPPGGGAVAVYAGYYDTHHPGNRQPKPSPWKGSSNVVFVGKVDSGGGWDTSAVRVDNLSGSSLSGVVVTVDIGSDHFALWGSQTIPAGGILIVAQTSGNNFDGSDTNDAGCYGCSSSLCHTRVKTTVPVVNVTVGGVTTHYRDPNQVLNTKGVDSAGCPYTGDRNDESQAWQKLN